MAIRIAIELGTSPALGANDRLHAATCLGAGIEHILTADRGFDELDLPRRIDPLDDDALGELIAQ